MSKKFGVSVDFRAKAYFVIEADDLDEAYEMALDEYDYESNIISINDIVLKDVSEVSEKEAV